MKAMIKQERPPAFNHHASPIEIMNHLENLKQSIGLFQQEAVFFLPFTRRLKVQPLPREIQGNPYNTVPSFTLCGNWLKHSGFAGNSHVRIITLKELLIIFPESAPAPES
jgi:hypothetical protein